VRRAGKFLPEKIEMVQYEGRTARESKVLFIEFKRDTDRARLAADVEIKVNTYCMLSMQFSSFLYLCSVIFFRLTSCFTIVSGSCAECTLTESSAAK